MPTPPPIAVARVVVARDADEPDDADDQRLPAVVLTLYRAPGSDGTYSLVMQRGGPDRR